MTTDKSMTGYVEVAPGVELYYESTGSGQPIVCIPGWTFTTEFFAHQVEHFSKSYRVITFDPRSHGHSTTTLQGNDYATHGADLARLLTALELKDVIVVCWSVGCLTLWEYIKQHGSKNISAAVCIDLSPKLLSANADDWVEGAADELAAVHNSYLQTPQGHREFAKIYATEVMVQRDLTEHELRWIVEQSTRTPYYIASNLFACAICSDYMVEAKQMNDSLPTLYVISEHWSETAVAFLNKHFPQIKTEVMGGHMMFWEHSDRFNAALERFIGELPEKTKL